MLKLVLGGAAAVALAAAAKFFFPDLKRYLRMRSM
ncbi:DUF6893 family small protein [Streptomyces chattanoogensis]